MIVVTIDTHDISRSERFETFGPFNNEEAATKFIEQAKIDAEGYFGEWDFYICPLRNTNRWGAPEAYPWNIEDYPDGDEG